MNSFGHNVHLLKINQQPFDFILNGLKKWEYRKNDRDYFVGDYLVLREYYPGDNQYSNRVIIAKVLLVISGGDFGIPEDYCIMSLGVVSKELTK